jgi:hypothetical protein
MYSLGYKNVLDIMVKKPVTDMTYSPPDQTTVKRSSRTFEEEIAELTQTVYIKDVLTSKWRSGSILHWGRDFCICPNRKRKAMFSI